MKSLMKSLIIFSNNVDAFWNRIMSVVGAPWLVFIFMRYIEVTSGYTNTVRIVIYFFVGVMVMAPTFLEAVICSFLSSMLFYFVRKWFLAGLFFGFAWWGHQTAWAAGISVAIINLAISILLMSRNGIE